MRIRNPPTFIMSTSLIMSLIMTLLVFQCMIVRVHHVRRNGTAAMMNARQRGLGAARVSLGLEATSATPPRSGTADADHRGRVADCRPVRCTGLHRLFLAVA